MSDKTINFGARCEYLSAIEAHWPDVMNSLRIRVLPVYRRCLETIPPRIVLQTLAGLPDFLKYGASSELNQFQLAVREWAAVHGFRDAWLRDAALQSMHTWACGGSNSKWTYLPEDLDTPKFEPDFGYWIPFFTKWPEFKRLTDERYRREQSRYRAKIRTLWGEGQPKLSQSAIWTIRGSRIDINRL